MKRLQTLPSAELADKPAVELRALLVQAIEQLQRLMPLLAAMTYVQPRGLPFVTVESKRMMDDQHRKERRDRVGMAKAGLMIPGASDAPVNIAAVSIAAEVPLALLDLNRRIRRSFAAAGVCYIKRPIERPTPAQVLSEALELAPHASAPLLLEAVRTCQDLAAKAETAAFGVATAYHPDPCPFCGRRSLVVHLEGEKTECTNDQCRCNDSYCDCRTPGRQHRHTWWRTAQLAQQHFRTKVVARKWTYANLQSEQRHAARARNASQRAPEESK